MNQHGAWTDDVGRWLIHGAARRAPETLSDRLEEEWLADWAARPQGAARLRFALGCCWATRVIAYEHQPTTVRVAGTAMGPKLALGGAHFNLGLFSRRSAIAFLVATLHVALFYVLLTKLSHTHFSAPPPPFDVAVLEQATPKLTPPPVDIKFKPTKITANPPEVTIGRDDDPGSRVETVGQTPPPVITAPPERHEASPAHVVQRIVGGPGSGFPNAEDFYPDAAKRLGEQGIATIQVCVDAKGRLTSEPTTLQGTGSVRLDQGALNLARAASGHYRASTEDGRPVVSCYPFRIRFQLRN